MVKLQEVKGQYTITIPKEKIKETGWQKGQELSINFDKRNQELIISKINE
jgi:bifunctional DNA-binding transcriptional regulator/antitoxin component of YhaV-PrlF toxin-antitoxin module